jgi:hypothetical protein
VSAQGSYVRDAGSTASTALVASTSLLAALQWRLSHGVPERVERSLGLPHRHIRSVTQLMALLHQASRRLARSLGHATYGYWKHRAAVEVRRMLSVRSVWHHRTRMYGCRTNQVRQLLADGILLCNERTRRLGGPDSI